MDKFGADGDVEINLTTVKVRRQHYNYYTYSLSSDSFQNWRDAQFRW
jgi:hypothetical protein